MKKYFFETAKSYNNLLNFFPAKGEKDELKDGEYTAIANLAKNTVDNYYVYAAKELYGDDVKYFDAKSILDCTQGQNNNIGANEVITIKNELGKQVSYSKTEATKIINAVEKVVEEKIQNNQHGLNVLSSIQSKILASYESINGATIPVLSVKKILSILEEMVLLSAEQVIYVMNTLESKPDNHDKDKKNNMLFTIQEKQNEEGLQHKGNNQDVEKFYSDKLKEALLQKNEHGEYKDMHSCIKAFSSMINSGHNQDYTNDLYESLKYLCDHRAKLKCTVISSEHVGDNLIQQQEDFGADLIGNNGDNM